MRWPSILLTCTLALSQTLLPLPYSSDAREQPVFLKLNEYYVFYAAPDPPSLHADSLFVSAAVLQLMSFKTTIDASHTMAIVRRGTTSLTATVGRSTYEVDPGLPGVKPRRLFSKLAPRRHQSGELLLPVRILIEVFGILANWDSRYRVLHLQDTRMMDPSSPTLSLFEENLLKTNSKRTEDLIPVSFSLGKATNPNLRQHEITIVLKDISARGIQRGRQGLYIVVEYVGGPAVMGGRDFFITPDIGRTTDPCRRSSSRVFTCVIQAPIYQNAIQYILGVTRVRN